MSTANHTLWNEPDLINAARRGEGSAYGELVRRHRDGVVRVVYRMCGDGQLAEEAAQEAFLRAWQRLDSYKPQHAFRAWIYRIAINAALDRLRADKPASALDDLIAADLPLDSAPTNPERLLEERQQAERVQRAVMALPAPSRAVLVLREWGDLPYAEIAAALNIPIGTVMSRLNTARGLLRQSLLKVLEVA